MDTKLLRQTFGKFATGVTVVTWQNGEEISGITVNSFTSVSLDPALVLVSIDEKARAYEQLKGKNFTINILSAEQEAICWQFAGRPNPDLVIDWDTTNVAPSIQGSAARIFCKPYQEVEAGDHRLYIGEIVDFDRTDLAGLTFFEGKVGTTINL